MYGKYLEVLHIVKDVGMWSIISSICLIIHPSIRPIIHPSCHGLFTPTENGWLCLEGLSRVAFWAFAFLVLPFSSQLGKVYEKKQEKKKTCLWWKNKKNTYYFFKKNPYSLPYLDNITGGLQGDYLKTDLYA